MRIGGKKYNSIKHNAGFGALLVLFALNAAPVLAADDPFDVESGHWMSFDHYKDADKRGILPAKPPEPADSPTSDTGASGAPTLAAPTVAAPTRPIDLPVMPGLNKGFTVQVNSTVDEQPAPSAAAGDVEKTSPVSDKNWQSPASVQTAKKAEDDDTEDVPLNVRLSYLPNQKVTPVASPDRPSALKAGHVALEKLLAAKAAQQAPKTPAETAACAAIDAHKKQELAAIQSDRETLKALQDAIHSLGLDKQLDFMQGGNNSALNLSEKQDTPTSVR
jgi:hypothetical protein